MSHLNERVQKNCLNCNAAVAGRYCQICGQENTEPGESVWHLVTHFFNDVTHFDGKFFNTLKYLLFKPGFLSREYLTGRRVSYLNPIRMYIFTSALFFLIFFSIAHPDSIVEIKYYGKTSVEIKNMDSVDFLQFSKEFRNNEPVKKSDFVNYIDTNRSRLDFQFDKDSISTRTQYDSLLASGKLKDNWLKRKLNYKRFEIREKYGNDARKVMPALLNTLFHSFPQILFLSLPLLALLLKLLYFRRKEFFYTSHAIFVVHLYIVVFIFFLIHIGFLKMHENGLIYWFNYFIAVLYTLLFIYQYKAMLNYYQQGKVKTLIKYLILNVGLFFIILFLLLPFIFFSFIKL